MMGVYDRGGTLIILEGPDGGGKSTLLEMLKVSTRLPVSKKAVSSDGQATTNIKTYVQKNLRQAFQRKLFDRFALISGPIYGNVSGMAPPNEVFRDRYWHFHMESLLMSMRPIIIYCLPPLSVIRTNLQRDPVSSEVVGPYIEQIYYQYQARAARDFAVGLTVVWDYTDPNLEVVVGRIQQRLSQLKLEGIIT